MKGFGFLLEFGGNRPRNIFGANSVILPDNRLHFDEVDHTLELVFLADRNWNGNRFRVKTLANGTEGVLEIRAHLVDLINEANARHAVLIGLAPDFFRLRLNAMDG